MKVFFLVYVEVSALDIFLCLFGGLALGLGARDSISRFVGWSFGWFVGCPVGPSVGPLVHWMVCWVLITRSMQIMTIDLV